MLALPWIIKREKEDADYFANCHRQTTAEFVGYGEAAENSIFEGNAEAALLTALEPWSRSSSATCVEGGGAQDLPYFASSTIASFESLSTLEDEKFRPPFFEAADEHFAGDRAIPQREDRLIPCRQIKVERDDLFSEPVQEPRTNYLTVKKEAASIKFEPTGDADSYWNSMPENDVKWNITSPLSIPRYRPTDVRSSNRGIRGQVFADGSAIKNCSVVLHPLDASLLKTASSEYDAITLIEKLKTQTQNCNQCKRASEELHRRCCKKVKDGGATKLQKIHLSERPHRHLFPNKVKNTTAHKKSEKKRPYQCSYCDKTFANKSNKNYHEIMHTREKSHQCSYCDKKFVDYRYKTRHERMHTGEKLHPCSYCDMKFVQISHRIMHERIHTGEKPFQCSYCDKKFAQNSHRRIHERTHTGEKPFQCSYCDKKFARMCIQVLHERTHTGEKAFRCSYCDKTFTRIYGQIAHERTHTGEKPFQCFYCDKKFARMNNKVVHERTHTGEKPYQCSYCDSKFTKSYHRNKHERRQHNGE